MSVQFDQENSFNKTFDRTFAKSNSSKMSTYLIKKGYAKNEKQANVILLGISAISILITIVVLNTTVFGGYKKVEIKAPPGYNVVYPEKGPPHIQKIKK
jgi:hypothetical protein